MPELTDLVPGFDAQQSFGLRTVAQEAARAALTEFRAGGCRVDCKEMTDVRRALFGASEDGVVGLDQRMAENEKAIAENTKQVGELVGSIVWFRRLVYSGIVLAVIGIGAAVVQAAAIGK